MDGITGHVNIYMDKDKEERQKILDECQKDEMLIEDVMKDEGFFDIETDGKHISAYFSGNYTDSIEHIFGFDGVVKADGDFRDIDDGDFRMIRDKDGVRTEEPVYLSTLSDEELVNMVKERGIPLKTLTAYYNGKDRQ